MRKTDEGGQSDIDGIIHAINTLHTMAWNLKEKQTGDARRRAPAPPPAHTIEFNDGGNQETEYALKRESALRARLDARLSGAPLQQNIETNKNVDFKAVKEEKFKMPPELSNGHFYFRTRPNGTLELRYKCGDEKYWTYGKTKQECVNNLVKKITGKTDAAKRPAQKHTFHTWIWDWYNRFRRAKAGAKTQKIHGQFINETISKIENKLLNRVSSEELQDYLNSLAGTPRKRDMIAVLLRACFLKALKLGYIKTDPCEAIEIKKHRSKHFPVIQLADQRRIFEAEKNPLYRKLFMLYCCTGLRLAELFNALPHIDFINNIIYVEEADTDTKKHRREIPFLPELLNEAERDALLKLTPNAVQCHFKRLFKTLNINAVVHSFRVTFISCCNYLDINPKQIQAWAGHSIYR